MPQEDSQITFNQRMLPSIDRQVSEIKEEDIRIRVLGTVIDKTDTSVIIDDGTGTISANFEEPVKAELKQLVRVFGRVINSASGMELQGEVLQDMTKLDMELYKKASKVFSAV